MSIPGPLGCRPSKTDEHVRKYPLSAPLIEALPPQPMAIGIPWYENFDTPVRRGGSWWIGWPSENLGSIRGWHAVCIVPPEMAKRDKTQWWEFFNQKSEGACVGFAASRMMAHLNRRTYSARWLWDRAKEIDEWPETTPGDSEGTSVRAACEILRSRGHVPWTSRYIDDDTWQERALERVDPAHGVREYRWATNVDDVVSVTGSGEYVTILNSWGRRYEHFVRLPAERIAPWFAMGAEFAIVTDKP